MELSFLFWNLNRRPLVDHVARLAALHRADVLMFAESGITPDQLQSALNADPSQSYSFPFSNSKIIQIFTRLPETSLIAQVDDPVRRITIRLLKPEKGPEITLIVAHLPSKLFKTEADQTEQAHWLAREIAQHEDKVGHRRTILVGDLNMNSFDTGMVAAHFLHAVMDRSVARQEERRIGRETYRLFYNPMWGCFGDRTEGPPGTYYLRPTKPVHYFWHMYDQVLLRPSLMDSLEQLRILDSDGEVSLLTPQGRPRVSDHLPIFFRLSL